MEKTLREALKASATFNIKGATTRDVKLAFLPGVYDTTLEGEVDEANKKNPCLITPMSSTANLVNAGYYCDQQADDFKYNNLVKATGGGEPVFNTVHGAEASSGSSVNYVSVSGANRVRYRDFLNTVQRVGIKVSKIIIQNKNLGSQDIFDQEIEIARTAVGAMGAMDFIQLQNYVSVHAYDRSKIEIDLSMQPLHITPEVYMGMNIPANASFSIQFVFEA